MWSRYIRSAKPYTLSDIRANLTGFPRPLSDGWRNDENRTPETVEHRGRKKLRTVIVAIQNKERKGVATGGRTRSGPDV